MEGKTSFQNKSTFCLHCKFGLWCTFTTVIHQSVLLTMCDLAQFPNVLNLQEHFLVPDHTITDITGASFAGFYYVCLQKSAATIEGYYYHRSSEWLVLMFTLFQYCYAVVVVRYKSATLS